MDMDNRLEKIDKQHRELFDVFIEMQSHKNSISFEEMEVVFEKLERYMFDHLTFEEQLMSNIRYPDIEQHVQEHNRIRTLILKHKQKHNIETFSDNDGHVLVSLSRYLEEWLRDHILSTDMKYRGFIQLQKANGIHTGRSHSHLSDLDGSASMALYSSLSPPDFVEQRRHRSWISYFLIGHRGRKMVMWLFILLAIVSLLLHFGVFPRWQFIPVVSNTATNGQQVGLKDTEIKNDKKIAFFYEKNMKDYYCRDYLKIACNSSRRLTNPITPEMENIYAGGEYYLKYCARCHGDNGKGNGPDAIRLRFSLERLGWAGSELLERDAYLFWIIAKGGYEFGGSMPQFSDILNEDQIWKIILFLKTLR